MIYICEKWVSRHRKYRVYFELQLIDGKKCEAEGPTAIGQPFSIPIYMGKRPGPAVFVCGAYAIRPYTSGFCFLTVRVGAYCIRPYPDVPDKGTEVGIRLFRRMIDWDRPGPAVPDCGAYAIRPYPDGRLFSSEWVGAYCIRPIRRLRKGDECGFLVVLLGD